MCNIMKLSVLKTVIIIIKLSLFQCVQYAVVVPYIADNSLLCDYASTQEYLKICCYKPQGYTAMGDIFRFFFSYYMQFVPNDP